MRYLAGRPFEDNANYLFIIPFEDPAFNFFEKEMDSAEIVALKNLQIALQSRQKETLFIDAKNIIDLFPDL